MKRRHLIAASALFWSPSILLARDDHHAKKAAPVGKLQTEWGTAGNAKSATRTIRISMTDDMRFTPDKVDVNQGDTVRFVVVNNGKLLHEFVLGTKPVLDRLADLVARSSDEVDHERADRLHVEPGRTGERIWNFNRAGAFEFACLFPGHYQAGMIGRVNVAAVVAKN